MKKILLLVISCVLFNISFAQNVMEKELQDAMNQKGDEMIDVSIMFKSQIDAAKLKAKAGRSNDKSIKRDIVVSELKDFSSRTQSDVMSILEAEESNGSVADINALWIVNAISCKASRDVIYKLASHPDVAVISYNREVQLLDNSKAREMDEAADDRGSAAPHVIQVNADDVWNQGYTGKNVIVAVLDSGTNINHYDLKDHLWVGYADTDDDGEEDDIIHGWNYISNNSDITDDFGHGTHCAGIVCGDGTVGITVGVAPDATLMTLKIVNRAGGGSVDQMLSGVQFAVENGADVISMSLGFKNNQITDAQKKEIRDAFVNVLESGVVVCAAAGNDGTTIGVPNNVDYPATCPAPWLHPDQKAINDGGVSSVICVGNVNSYNNHVSSSSEGPVTWQGVEGYNDYPYNGTTTFGLIRPDICAPGELVYSLKHDQVDKYKYMSGTSQATPGVAGVIALMLEKNSSLTPAQMCEIIETTASNKPAVKNNQVGSGVVDALSAVNEVEAYDAKPYLKITHQSPTSMASGNGKVLNIYITNQGKGVCENASATLISNDQYVAILTDEVSLGTIDVNASKEVNFTLNVSDDTPNGHTASFTLTSTNGTLTWSENFTIKIDSYARIVYQSSQGSIDAGTGVQLNVNMINKGTIATTENTDVNLSTNSSFVTISDNTATLGAMNVNEEKTAIFTIDIDESIPDQAIINFDLYSTPNNYSVARNITYEFESELDQYGSPTDGFNGWTTFDNSPDGRNHPWWHSQNAETHKVADIGSCHSGSGQLMSETYCVASMQAYSMPVDNFLVSPKIKATANSKIKFFARAHYNFPGERFQVTVSEASNNIASDFTTLSSYEINGTDYSEWKEYEVDLSSYEGKEIYVAIRHSFTSEQWSSVDNGFDTYILHIDDVTLYDVIDISDNFKNDNYSYFSIIVNSEPLPAPENFTANANGTSAINLAWNTVTNAQRYNIYRDGNWLTSVASTATSYTDNNLTHNTQYCYEIASVYSGIEYEHSKSVCATTVQKDYSAAVECSPQTIDVDGTTALPLVLTITNDGKYEFKSRSSYTLTCEEDEYVSITNNNDNLAALAAGAYAEKTINISVNENILDNSVIHFNLNITSIAPATDPDYFTFDVPFEVAVENPLRAPKNIVAKEQYANSIPLLWDAAPKATSYDIYRDGVKIANTSQTMYVDNGLEKETTYCYTLKSLTENLESEFSEEVCATTLAEDAGIVVQSFNLIEDSEYSTLTVTFVNKTDAATVAATTATLTSSDPYVINIVDNSAVLGVIGVGETATAEFSMKLDASIPENHDMDFNITVETEGVDYDEIQYTFDSDLQGWTTYTQNFYGYNWEYNTDKDCIISYSYRDGYGNINPYNFICSPTKIRMSDKSHIIWDVASSYSGDNTYYKEHYEVYITNVDPTGTTGWENLENPIHNETLTEEHKNYNFITTTADASSAADTEVWVVFLHNDCEGQEAILVDNIKITNVLMQTQVQYYNSISVTPSVPEPVELTATANGIDKVNLSWNVVARAESYNIYRNNEFIANTTETSYTDNNLTHNTTYYYKVLAESNDVEYSHSELVSVTTEQKDYSVIVEASPQTVDVLGLTTVSLDITIFNDGANEIDSEYTLTYDNDYVIISDNTDYIESLQYGEELTETIEIKIKKNVPDNYVLDFSLNLLSMEIPFEIEVSNPSRVPENLIANGSTDAYSLTLSWDEVEGASSYNIYRNEEFIASTTTTTYTDKVLNAGTNYCYKVTSVIGTVESDFSDEACATTSTIDGKVFVQSYEITEVGNTVTLTATLVNNTDEATPEGTTATLSCNDQYVTVIDNATAEVGSIAVGGTKTVEYTFELADNTPSNHNLDFNVIVESVAVTSDLTYNFDDSDEGWYCLDWNNDNGNWEHQNASFRSYSFYNGKAVTPDNLLISPQSVGVTSGSKLIFEVSSIDTYYYEEHYGIYITETYPDGGWPYLMANSITSIHEETLDKADVQTKEVDLSSYAGKNIWIIFRHWNCSKQYAIVIDNVEITNVSSSGSGVGFAYTSSLTVTVNSLTNMFTGTGLWATAANWSKGSVPEATDDVIVKGNVTIGSGNVTVNSLVVYNEASLTINNGAGLTVNNSLVNSGAESLILNDGAQLVQHNDKVRATFNMSIVNPSDWESTMNKDGWQFVASPFEDAAITQFVGTDTHYDLYKYNGSEDDEWRNYKSTSQEFTSGIFDQGEGHLLSHKNMSVVALSGTLNNLYSYTWSGLSYDNNKDLANFHLLGNPFTFDMDLEKATFNNMVEGVAVVKADGGYDYSETVIPVGDGFFVKTASSGASLSYNATKGEENRDREVQSVNLIVSGNAGKDNVVINLSGESEGFDKLENFNEAIANIFVVKNDKRYGIAYFDSNVTVVNVAFEVSEMGNYSISALPNGEFDEITLIDRFTGIETNLLMEVYNFTATNNDSYDRFIVKLKVNGQQSTDNGQFVYQSGEDLILGIEGKVQIIDMMGRTVYSNDVTSTNNRINVSNFNDAAYIVRVINEEGVNVQKVVIY